MAEPEPSKPPPATDLPTVISDLSGKSGAPSSADQPTLPGAFQSDATKPTVVPTKVADTQMTRLQGVPPSSGRTQITDLHVDGEGASRGHDPAGTHRGQVWGDFRLGELLGRGGMGAVYQGIQVSLDRPVAVKVLPEHLSQNEGFRARFQLEAKAVAKLSSPHVIQVYGAGVHEGHHYFAMEYVEGEDLARKLKNGLKPTYAQSLDYVIQAARGLAAAGELGIVHRDIKPANMMVTGKGVLKLMDFGLVKLASEDHSLTMSGTIMGTVSYFSPEQGRGERCDQRTDLYALGVVFYELLTGKLPFTGGDATSIIYQHIHQEPKPPKEIDPQIPEAFQAVALKCMQKRAEDRYQTAAELLDDLVRIEKGLEPARAMTDPTALRHGATVVKSPPFAAEKRGGRGVLIAVALLAAAAGGGWYAYQYGPLKALLNGKAEPTTAKTEPTDTPPRHSVPIDAQPPRPERPKPDAARALLQSGKLIEARRLADQELGAQPDDAGWKQVSADIDAARGTAALAIAQQAFDKGDLNAAGAAAAEASALLKDSPELAKLISSIKDKEGAKKQRERTLAEAENLLAGGDWAKAQELLTRLETESPGEPEVAKASARAQSMQESAESIGKAVREQLANADQAITRKDYDSALLAYTAAKQLDPKNAAASDGLERVNQAKTRIAEQRATFDQSIDAGDLAAAEKGLLTLRESAPGSTTLAAAENRLAAARLTNEQARRESEAREAKLSGQAKTLLTRLDDPAQPLDALTRDATAFTAQLAPERPERALIERRLEDRRSREQVASELKGLDAAVLAGDAAAIAAVVDDRDFAEGLAALKRYEGLVFASTLADFVRQDDKATAKVTIRHALKVFPERQLVYVLELRRADSAWRVAAAHLQP